MHVTPKRRIRATDQSSRFKRPRVTAALAALALSMLPLQGLALANAGSQQAHLRATAASAAFHSLPSEASFDVAAATAAPRLPLGRTPEAAASRAQQKADEDPAYDRFAERWSPQAAATQDVKSPDTTRWALLIGINEHSTSVRDNFGSAQDAQDLREFLLTQGWRDDHIVLMNDLDATRDNILAGMTWLAKKTNADSVAIYHYSGHSKKWYGQDYDGDGEITDEGLWPSDGKFIADSEMARQLSGVNAGKFWISIGACNSTGFNDPGLARAGRLLTFSSTEQEKSYEDPSVENSVYGFYFFEEGFKQGYGDLNGDGRLTVEETFEFARPRAYARTEGQKYGNQSAVMVDQLEGDFDFAIPAPPPEPEPEKDPEQGGDNGLLCPIICTEH
ncbi:MAG: hypothetical protein ACI867_000916 [Glaciecola sp.]